MIAAKVKRILQKLQRLYRTGIISYPRVDNNFIKENRYDMFPHPAMSKTYSQIFKPFKPSTKIKLTQKSSLLYLSLVRLMTPSNIFSFAKLIDEYFDEDLEFQPNKHRLALNIIGETEAFLQEHSITEKNILDKYSNIFIESQRREYCHYIIDNVEFTKDAEECSRIKKIIPKELPVEEDELDSETIMNKGYYSTIKKRSSLKQALKEYRLRQQKELSIIKHINKALV